MTNQGFLISVQCCQDLDQDSIRSLSQTNTTIRKKLVPELHKTIDIYSKEGLESLLECALAAKDLSFGTFSKKGRPAPYKCRSDIAPFDLFGYYHTANSLTISASMESLSELKYTEQMRLWENKVHFDFEHSDAYYHPLVAALSLLPNLTSLKFNLTDLSYDNEVNIFDCIYSWSSNLKTLHLDNIIISEPVLFGILNRLESLQELSITLNCTSVIFEFTANEVAKVIAQHLLASHTLKVLKMETCPLDYLDTPVDMLSVIIANITELSMSTRKRKQMRLTSLHLLGQVVPSASVLAAFFCSPASSHLQDFQCPKNHALAEVLDDNLDWKKACEGKQEQECFFKANTDLHLSALLFSPLFLKKVRHRIVSIAFSIGTAHVKNSLHVAQSAELGHLPRLQTVRLIIIDTEWDHNEVTIQALKKMFSCACPHVEIIKENV